MEATMTPLPTNKPLLLSFINAMREIQLGNKVTRVSWNNKDYCLLKDGWLSIYTKGEFHTWSINDGDMEGNDWIITMEAN